MHKVSISSMRVLQMLQLLFEKSYTMNELMDAMSELTGEACTNFLISKYINTCRFSINLLDIDTAKSTSINIFTNQKICTSLTGKLTHCIH